MATRTPRSHESYALHTDRDITGRTLSASERERIIRPYLPPTRDSPSKHPPVSASLYARRPRLRPVLTHLLHLLVYHLIQLVFTLYIHTRRTYHALSSALYSILYYHHHSPEFIQRDVSSLSRLPKHLSIIVDLQSDDANAPAEDLEKLMADVAETSAWCACAGIGMLSVYERTGALKQNMRALNEVCRTTIRSYYPPENAPNVHLRTPSHQFSPGGSRSPSPNPPAQVNGAGLKSAGLVVLLLSASDGRDTLVDLTKTLAEMAQKGKLAPSDVTPELIDAEVAESSFAEPDLLVVMAPSPISSLMPRRKRRRRVSKESKGLVNGDVKRRQTRDEDTIGVNGGGGEICLRGYPPWQVRLTEIFYVKDGRGIEYQTFLRALHRYAKAEMRFGR